MRRRTLLAALASAGAATAGCIGDGATDGADGETPTATPGDDADTGTQTDTPTPTPTEESADATASVTDVTLQRGLVVPTTPDSIGVTDENRRFVWAQVSTSGGTIPREEFAFDVGTEAYAPTDDTRAYRTGWHGESRFEGEGGWLLFELPLQVDEPALALTWPGGEHRASTDLGTRLGQQPPTTSATLLKRYEGTPERPVAVEVTNEGTVAARFVAALNRQGPAIAYAPVTRVSTSLSPGETRTLPIEDPVDDHLETPDDDDGPPEMTYHLIWAGGDDDAVFGGD